MKNMPLEAWILFIVGLLIFIFIFGRLVVLAALKRGVKVGRFELPAKKQESSGSHIDCPRHNDIMIIESSSSETGSYEAIITHVETLREQMDFAKHTMNNLINDLQEYYLKELKRYIPDDRLTQSEDFKSYCQVLELFKIRLLRSFEHFCIENHLADLSDLEFENYSSVKSESLLNEGSQILHELYLHTTNITREKLYELNAPHISEFLITIKSIIINARKVAIKNKEIIVDKWKELHDLLASFVGENNPMLKIWDRQHNLI